MAQYVLDTNVLLRAAAPKSAHHAATVGAAASCRPQPRRSAVREQTAHRYMLSESPAFRVTASERQPKRGRIVGETTGKGTGGVHERPSGHHPVLRIAFRHHCGPARCRIDSNCKRF